MNDLNQFDKVERLQRLSWTKSIYKVKKNNLWGIFYDGKNSLILPIEFDHIEIISENIDNFYLVSRNNLWGLYFLNWSPINNNAINFKGFENKLPIEFDNIRYISDHIFEVKKNNLWGAYHIIHENARNIIKHIIPIEFEQIEYLRHSNNLSVYKVKINNLWGLFELHTYSYSYCGKRYIEKSIYTIPTMFNEINIEGYGYNVKKDNVWGVYSSKGLIVPIENEQIITGYYEYKVKKNNLWGLYFYNNKKPIIPIEYDEIEYISGDIYKVRKNNLWGAYYCRQNNFESKLIIPIKFNAITLATKNLILAQTNNKFDIFHLNGELYIQDVDKIESLNDNIIIKKGESYGVNDIIPVQYDSIKQLGETRFIISKNNKFGFYSEGTIIEPDFDEVIFQETFIIVKRSRFYGLFTLQGNTIVPTLFETICSIEKNLFVVNKDIRYGLIRYFEPYLNSPGTTRMLLPLKYDSIKIKYTEEEFPKPYLIVRENGLYGFTTINGIFFIPPKYEEIKEIKEEDYIWELSDRSYLITQNNKYGIFRRKFEIIPCIFDSIEYDGCEVLCKCNNHIYRYDKYGERVRYNAAFGYLKRTERSGSNIKYYYSPFHEDKNSVDLIY